MYLQKQYFSSKSLAVIAIGLLSLPQSFENTVAPKGTLVIAVPCASGMALVADKRTKDWLQGIKDHHEKIVQIDSQTAVTSTGNPEFYFEGVFDSGGKLVKLIPGFEANQIALTVWRETGDRFPFATKLEIVESVAGSTPLKMVAGWCEDLLERGS